MNESDSVAEKKSGLKLGDECWIGETAVMQISLMIMLSNSKSKFLTDDYIECFFVHWMGAEFLKMFSVQRRN